MTPATARLHAEITDQRLWGLMYRASALAWAAHRTARHSGVAHPRYRVLYAIVQRTRRVRAYRFRTPYDLG